MTQNKYFILHINNSKQTMLCLRHRTFKKGFVVWLCLAWLMTKDDRLKKFLEGSEYKLWCDLLENFPIFRDVTIAQKSSNSQVNDASQKIVTF